jgi:hypothetical protein
MGATALSSLLFFVPMTFRSSVWYSSVGFAALAVVAAIALYGFKTSLGGRRLLELADG